MSDTQLDCASRLREIMECRNLSRAAIACLLGVSQFTVASWLADSHAHKFRHMPAPYLQLLELELRLLPETLEDALALEELNLTDMVRTAIRNA